MTANLIYLRITIPLIGAHSLAFYFVRIECVTCPVHESFFVFNSRAPIPLRHSRPFTRSHSFKKHVTLDSPHCLVLLLSRLWNSGAAIKSVVMIFTVGSGEGPTV